MSADDSGESGNREVAYRVFAAEYEDADFSYSESDEERAPNYVITPTGARVNRLFVVGVLTETEQVNEDVLRARIVDPTGAFVAYAGQYQPDELAFLERADPPMFVALTGKARTFQPDDSDTVYTSIRPESINEVDAETRDRWVVNATEQTLDRVATMAEALARDERGEDLADAMASEGVSEALASGIALAIEHYGTTPTYLKAVREMALDAARVVADELDEVDELTTVPDQGGAATLSDLADVDPGAVSRSSPSDTTTSAGESTEPSTTESTASAETTTTESPEPAETTTTETASQSEPGSTSTGSESPSTEESADVGANADDDIGDFEPGEFELDEEEREEVKEEYGTDFETGNTVEEPGEADIETPDPEELDAEAESAATGTESTPGGEPAADQGTEPAPESVPDTEPEPADETGEAADAAAGSEDVDLEDAVVEVMSELNGDSGAEREAVVEAVVDRHGADPDAVEDAIQDALMDGRCYEPDDTTLKPI